jgi:hypothetical protein
MEDFRSNVTNMNILVIEYNTFVQGVPHHLLDIVLPTEDYTAGCFFDDARAATEDVLARGSVPIVVGGTGMYLRWYVMFYHPPFKVTIEVLSLSSV